jgi:regulator of RNase E activity RraA
MRSDERCIAELRRLATATVSDALDTLGVNGGLEGLRPIAGGMALVGPVFTVQFEPVSEGERAPAADYIDEVPAGHVVLLANGGRQYCTVWGDLLARTALLRGVAGTVIDGCCRDATAIIGLRYPVFARSAYMKSGKNRVRMVAKQVPVTVSGQAVAPGDVVCADDSGAIVVPRARLAEVTERALAIERMESRIAASIAAGVSLKEARDRENYNQWAVVRQGSG